MALVSSTIFIQRILRTEDPRTPVDAHGDQLHQIQDEQLFLDCVRFHGEVGDARAHDDHAPDGGSHDAGDDVLSLIFLNNLNYINWI